MKDLLMDTNNIVKQNNTTHIGNERIERKGFTLPPSKPTDDSEREEIKFDIGTVEGNNDAVKYHSERIKVITDELNIQIIDNSHFVPKSTKHRYIRDVLISKDPDIETQMNHNKYVILKCCELMELRITTPSDNSTFKNYYLDTLFFIENGFPLSKDNDIYKIIVNSYCKNFFVNAQRIYSKITDIKEDLEKNEIALDSARREIEIEYGQFDFNQARQGKGEVFVNYRKKFGKLISAHSNALKTICDMLANPLQTINFTSNDIAVLISNLLEIAYVTSRKDVGLNHNIKVSAFRDNKDTLIPLLSFYNKKEMVWHLASDVIDNMLSVISDSKKTRDDSIKVLNTIHSELLKNADEVDICLYDPFIMPFSNGNYNIRTKEFNTQPDKYLEPTPARLKVRYNRDAKYTEYDKYGITPLDYLTFPFTNGDYTEEDIRERKIFAGMIVADIMLPFNRSFGHESMYWFSGGGNTGKTTFVEMLQNIVGKFQAPAVNVAELDKDKFALGNIHGKFLIIGNEATDDGKMGVTKLKSIASGDRTVFEEKYKSHSSIVPTATVVITSNGRPNPQSDGGATARRLRSIPFEAVFQKESIDSSNTNKNNRKDNTAIKNVAILDDYFLECIVNYALDMVEQHATRKAYEIQMPIPKSVKNDTEKTIRQNDIIHDFADFLTHSTMEPTPIKLEHLYTVYEIYATAIGKNKFMGNINKFMSEIVNYPCIKKLSNKEKKIELNGYTLTASKSMARSTIKQTQFDIANNIRGLNSETFDLNTFLDSRNNAISLKSTTYRVVWLLPSHMLEEHEMPKKLTTAEIFENAELNNEKVDESDIPF